MTFETWPRDQSYSLFSAQSALDVQIESWSRHAENFFGARLTLESQQQDNECLTWSFSVAPSRGGVSLRIALRAYRAEIVDAAFASLVQAAHRAVEAMGGAGFDALLSRAKHLWQVQTDATSELHALVVVGVAAFAMGAPVLAPSDARMFGVKGVRERLERGGWKT